MGEVPLGESFAIRSSTFPHSISITFVTSWSLHMQSQLPNQTAPYYFLFGLPDPTTGELVIAATNKRGFWIVLDIWHLKGCARLLPSLPDNDPSWMIQNRSAQGWVCGRWMARVGAGCCWIFLLPFLVLIFQVESVGGKTGPFGPFFPFFLEQYCATSTEYLIFVIFRRFIQLHGEALCKVFSCLKRRCYGFRYSPMSKA